MFTFVQMLSPVVALLGLAGVAYCLRAPARALQPVRVRVRR
ncbi:hypothetical protein MSKU15_2678 [Komagataeibacter diospyri]|uniref:Uncharacterized protein n=1 Tax=Komagataeibacter diospyri TaxID=1932662 RepID=A0A4P5P1A5_9PROT|nr:hypothetical protein MSKU9_2380 [Komagataeibacter diospyri]GCE91077.1 hypothetical protein MSKU15_2678 [Komagataeibacter diospyri]